MTVVCATAYTNSPIANYKGEIYNMPFNMNTFNKLWGVRTPAEAEEMLTQQRKDAPETPSNLENRLSVLWAGISTKSWLKVIRRNSGDVTAVDRVLSLNVFPCVSPMTITTLTTVIREFQRAVIMCWIDTPPCRTAGSCRRHRHPSESSVPRN